MVGWLGRFLPLSAEIALLRGVWGSFTSTSLPDSDPRFKIGRRLFNYVKAQSDIAAVPIEFRVVDSEVENAYAAPGGIVVLYTGLLKAAQSENEVSMVLGHEIGHIVNRDVAANLARVVFSIFQGTLLSFFDENTADLESYENKLQLAYSREQETAADEYGLLLLQRAYGHVGGATEFFARHALAEDGVVAADSTHPLPSRRVAHLKELIQARGYKISQSTQLK